MKKNNKKVSFLTLLSILGISLVAFPLSLSTYIKSPTSLEININIKNDNQNIVTIYFQDKAWWNVDVASTSIYYWGSIEEAPAWPGTRMQLVSYDEVSGCNTWKFDIDTSLVTGFIFVRTHSDYQLETMPEGVDPNWGAQTVDITYKEGVNLYTLENTEPSWGGGESACTVIEGVYNG